MKRLLILRHAKSSQAAPGMRDFDRPLNAIGRATAEAMGREMRALGLDFDAVAASPARRVTETIDHLATGLGRALAPRFDQRIYVADADGLLDIVRAADDSIGGVLLVGHNPGLAILARGLAAPDATADYQALSAKFPPGALAEIDFAVERWIEIGTGSGRLVRFLRPGDLPDA